MPLIPMVLFRVLKAIYSAIFFVIPLTLAIIIR
jgi:hypothetical protein